MSGYLRSALSRGFGADDSGSRLRPFVRTASPIADMDQRIGLPGFDSLGAPPPPNAGGIDGSGNGFDGPVAPRGLGPVPSPRGRPPIPRTASPRPAAPVVSEPLGTALAEPEPARPAPAKAEKLTEPIPVGRADPQPRPSPSAGPNSPRRESRPPAGAAETQRSPSRTSPCGPVAEVPPRAPISPPILGSLAGESAPIDGFGPSAQPGLDEAPSREVTGFVEPEPVQDSAFRATLAGPVPPAAPGQNWSTDGAPAAALDHVSPDPRYARDEDGPPAQAAPAPRLVIGEVNVEVVKSAAPPSQGAAPTPATAAGVSQIGPLSGGIGARRLLRLRGR